MQLQQHQKRGAQPFNAHLALHEDIFSIIALSSVTYLYGHICSKYQNNVIAQESYRRGEYPVQQGKLLPQSACSGFANVIFNQKDCKSAKYRDFQCGWISQIIVIACMLPFTGCTEFSALFGVTTNDPAYKTMILASNFTWGILGIDKSDSRIETLYASTSISTSAYTPTAAFLGNQLAIVGAALDAPNTPTGTLLVRENNCSLTQYAIGSETIVTTLPIADNYLHTVSSMSSKAGSFPNGCDNRSLGTPSAPVAFLGKTSNGEVLAAITLYGSSGYTLNLGLINSTKPSVHSTELAKGVAETMSVADVNGDKIADIVTPFITANNQSGIGVFLSNPDGSFNPVSVYPTDYGVYASHRISIEDINTDGKLDIVSLGQIDYSSPPKLSTLLGNGDGSFQVGTSLEATLPHWFDVSGSAVFVIADFNGDNKKDVLTASGFLLQGNGDGSFQPSEQGLNAILYPRNLAVGDFNGDNKLDVATTSLPGGGNPTISIFTGTGDGHFTPGASYAGMRGADFLTATDINGDGFTDLHIGLSGPGVFGADLSSQSVMQFLFGYGDGTFIGAQALAGSGLNILHQGVPHFALADFSGNGYPAIMTVEADAAKFTNPPTPTPLTLRNASASGQFGIPKTVTTLSFAPQMLTVGDANGDGKPDVIAATSHTQLLAVVLGLGDEKFADPQNYALPTGTPDFGSLKNLAVGDFNGDQHTDVVLVMGGQSADHGGVYVYYAKPDGSLETPLQIDATTNIGPMTSGDLNGDTYADLIIAGLDPQFSLGSEKLTGIRLYLGNAEGSFSVPLNLSSTLDTSALAIADMNKDQKADLVVGSYDAGLNSSVVVFPGLGDGHFGTANTMELAGGGPGTIAALTVADFTADGNPDVMIAGQHYTEVLGGNGDGTLTGENALIIAGGADNLVATDLNKDTLPDVVASVTYQGLVSLVRTKSAVNPTELPKADLAVTLSGSKKVEAGQDVSYTLTVKNKTNRVVEAVKVISDLPDSITLVSKPDYCSLSAQQLTCDIGTLGKKKSKAFKIKVKTTTAGEITHSTQVSADIDDTNPLNNTASSLTTVTPAPLPDLAVTLSGAKKVKVGKHISYAVKAINKTNVIIRSVKVISELPNSTTLVSKPDYCSVSANLLTCEVGTLGKKKSKLINIKVKTTVSGEINHTTQISSASIVDSNLQNNSATILTTVSSGK